MLELTPEQERHKEAQARHHSSDKPVGEQWSGADLVTFWRQQGVIGLRQDIKDSLEHARAIRRKAERRTRV